MANVQNLTALKFVTTDTTANSLIVGGATANATSGTGGVKCGPIVNTTLAASAAITGATTATIDTGTIAGLMPATGAMTVKAIHQMTGTTDNLAGFFAVKSAIDASALLAFQSYAYATVASPSTIALVTGGLTTAEHAGTGTVTSLRASTAEFTITSSGGGTNAACYTALPTARSGGSGTFTDAYAFRVGTFGAGITNKYSFFSSDATATMSQTGPLVLGTTLAVTGISTFTGDVLTTAWTDYSGTSTVVGWSAFTTKKIFYKKIGKLVWVAFQLEGTSDATTATFTVPVARSNDSFTLTFPMGGDIQDNSVAVTTNAFGSIASAGSTVSTGPSAAGGGWTNSGTKRIAGQFFYEATS
jgi:hypothetical protein